MPTNAEVTKAFFAATDAGTQAEILSSISKHYGISPAAALVEVTDVEAEHLLDYLVEPVRTATRILIQRHGLAN